MIIETKFDIEQIVTLKTDPNKLERMIVGIKINPDLVPIYFLAHGNILSDHYECEIQVIQNTNNKAGFKK